MQRSTLYILVILQQGFWAHNCRKRCKKRKKEGVGSVVVKQEKEVYSANKKDLRPNNPYTEIG
jgi:hypothetical protein